MTSHAMTDSLSIFAKPMARLGTAVVLTVAVLLPHSANSQPKSETPADLQPTREAAPETQKRPEPTNQVIPQILQKLRAASSGATERERSERDALKAFYGRPTAAPLWIDGNGLSGSARQVMAELANADAFGLDPSDFAIAQNGAGGTSPDDLAGAELALSLSVLKYARHAKGGRARVGKLGSQLTDPIALPEPAGILDGLEKTSDRADYLRKLHPQHAEFEALRQKLSQLRQPSAERTQIRLPEGPILRKGISHPNVAILKRRLGLDSQAPTGSDPARFDQTLEDAVKKFQSDKSLVADGIVGPGTRQALNADRTEQLIQRILVNMERWRWLPEDLGGEAGQYVWVNIPEYRVRVIKDGQTVLSERAIVGKVDKQTPVFSDRMEWIEIHPTWYVPNSIKVDDILPSLRRSTSQIMQRYHLRMDCGPNGRDPTKVDWNRVDIRTCSFSQPPGEKSVLGDFKFKFPNKHAVYMHDTLLTNLFNGNVRTYSHGCVRIENPRRMAEVLLAHDKSLSPARIGEILAGPKQLHKAELNRAVPVHLTYFTAGFEENGGFVTRPDYYGNDRRLADLLTGKGHLLPAAQKPGRRARTVRRRPPPASTEPWWEQITMQN